MPAVLQNRRDVPRTNTRTEATAKSSFLSYANVKQIETDLRNFNHGSHTNFAARAGNPNFFQSNRKFLFSCVLREGLHCPVNFAGGGIFSFQRFQLRISRLPELSIVLFAICSFRRCNVWVLKKNTSHPAQAVCPDWAECKS